MFGIGHTELIIFAIIGVLLFGTRLPKIARDLGSSLVQFKKGLAGIEDEVKK